MSPLVEGRELTSCRAQFALTIPHKGYRHVTAKVSTPRLGRLNPFRSNGLRARALSTGPNGAGGVGNDAAYHFVPRTWTAEGDSYARAQLNIAI